MNYQIVIEHIRNKNKFTPEDYTQLIEATPANNVPLLNEFLSTILHIDGHDIKREILDPTLNIEIEELIRAIERFALVVSQPLIKGKLLN